MSCLKATGKGQSTGSSMSQAQTGNLYINHPRIQEFPRMIFITITACWVAFMLSIEMSQCFTAEHCSCSLLSALPLLCRACIQTNRECSFFSMLFYMYKLPVVWVTSLERNGKKKNVRKNWGKKSLWKKKHVFSIRFVTCPFITETMGMARFYVLHTGAKAIIWLFQCRWVRLWTELVVSLPR